MSVFHLDIFPEISAPIRRVIYRPLGVLGIAFAVAVLCGLTLHPRVFALAAGLGLVMVLGTCWPWLSLRFTRAKLSYSSKRATEGENVELRAELTNPLPWPILGIHLKDSRETFRLGRLGSRSKVRSRWEIVPQVRGIYPQEPLQLNTGFPFGIWEPQRETTIDEPLIVWPKTVAVGPIPIEDASEVVDGNVSRNKVGTLGDVLGVRPYRRGDSPRRIHWGQTARHDRLIVCELQANIRPVVMLILDIDTGVHTSGLDGSREWAIRTVASLAKGWLGEGAQVGVIWAGFTLPPASGGKQCHLILDALAAIPDSIEPLDQVLHSPGLRSLPGIRIVVTTDRSHAFQSPIENSRLVILDTSGFPGEDESATPKSCNEGLSQTRPRVWLRLSDPAELPRQLRLGSTEARHGS